MALSYKKKKKKEKSCDAPFGLHLKEIVVSKALETSGWDTCIEQGTQQGLKEVLMEKKYPPSCEVTQSLSLLFFCLPAIFSLYDHFHLH